MQLQISRADGVHDYDMDEGLKGHMSACEIMHKAMNGEGSCVMLTYMLMAVKSH